MRLLGSNLVFVLVCGLATYAGEAERRAVEFLSKEVPQWRVGNGCFSCHNNGDGARALHAAKRAGYDVADSALANTNGWLSDPTRWDDNQGNPGFSNKALARIQFGGAIVDWGNGEALQKAASALVGHQSADGSWAVEPEANLGSPATYGVALGTYRAKEILIAAGERKFAAAIARADRYLAARKAESTVDAAALVMAGQRQWQRIVLAGQAGDGGFGPYANSPSEVFDTAIALLALRGSVDKGAMERGRAFLLRSQEEDGGWAETTRPSGSQSYAQRISTSAWALLALLATNGQ